MMPKISVLLTSYNHEKFIAQAIDSVLSQTFSDFELIIVDDASTDGSWEIIQGYDDPRITAIRAEGNTCCGLFFDTIPRCIGQYVATHHSDDLWEPDKLEKQLEYMEAHSETIACFTHVQMINEFGDNCTPGEEHLYHNKFNQPNRNRFEWLRFFFEEGNALCHPSIMIRREIYSEFGALSIGLKQLPDYLLWIRVCLAGEIHILQEKLTKFRLHSVSEANVSGDKLSNHIRSEIENYIICDEIFKISDERLFHNIFTEYETDKCIPGFILAKKMIETGYPPKQLYGLDKIFKLINKPESACQIEKLHNYTYLDFIKDTEKHDIFTKANITILSASLFYNCGNGFNLTDALFEPVYVRKSGEFYMKFVLPDSLNINELRFDPDEGRSWDIVIYAVNIDGIAQEATAENAISKTDDYDTFVSTDPIYILSMPPQPKVVEIYGKIRPASVSALNIYNENMSLKFKLDTLAKKQDALINSTSWKITKPLRAVIGFFKFKRGSKNS